ncbi:MAG TPA: ATP-binding protein [Planctomycetota bacterium]|nr:ATP-binding protein [Planctomycetota bacterium]
MVHETHEREPGRPAELESDPGRSPVKRDGAEGELSRLAPILLVDDREENLVALEAMLKDLGHDLVRASSGQEALRLLFHRDFAVILLDVRMPDMDGFETAENIRKRQRSRHTPIIFITAADASADQIGRGYAVGAVDFLFKPFMAEALKSKVRIFLELFKVNLRLRGEIAERERAQQERDRLTAELLQGQKLQALGQLSAGIAHEINNPLGYILSNLAVLDEYLERLGRLLGASLQAVGKSSRPEGSRAQKEVERLSEATDPEFLLRDFKSALWESRQGGEKIRDIVQSLREFSHVDEHDLKSANLNQCVENALRLCTNELKHKAVVRQDLKPLPLLSCYPQQIEQVLVNLLVNAAQSIAEKGRIAVSTRVEEGRIVIRIQDSGCGIPPEHLEKLFEPFFTTKAVGKGTGLGLHVAYKIVTAHGGKIDVASKVGEGSEFTVTLPVSGPAVKPR